MRRNLFFPQLRESATELGHLIDLGEDIVITPPSSSSESGDDPLEDKSSQTSKPQDSSSKS